MTNQLEIFLIINGLSKLDKNSLFTTWSLNKPICVINKKILITIKLNKSRIRNQNFDKMSRFEELKGYLFKKGNMIIIH